MAGMMLMLGHWLSLAVALAGLAWLERKSCSDRNIYAAALVMGAVLAVAGFIVSEPGFLFADFEKAYWRAGKAILSGPDALAAVLGPQAHGFVNLPILAFAFVPFALLPAKLAGVIWLGLGTVALVFVWRILKQWAALDVRTSAQLIVLLCATGPMMYGLKEGNSSHFVLWAALAGIVSAHAGKPFQGGALMGLAALIKPPLLVLGAYYVLRRNWRVAGSGAALVVGAGASSVIVLGWDVHAAWYETSIARYSQLTLGTFNVQSVASFFARLERGVDGFVDWAPFALSKFHRFSVQAILVVIVGAALAVSVAARRAASPVEHVCAERLEIAMALIVAAIASPLSWSHYFVWLFPAIALLMRPQADESREMRGAFWVAVGLYAPLLILVQPSFEPLRKLTLLAASAPLYAALIFMALLIRRRVSGLRSPVARR